MVSFGRRPKSRKREARRLMVGRLRRGCLCWLWLAAKTLPAGLDPGTRSSSLTTIWSPSQHSYPSYHPLLPNSTLISCLEPDNRVYIWSYLSDGFLYPDRHKRKENKKDLPLYFVPWSVIEHMVTYVAKTKYNFQNNINLPRIETTMNIKC